MRPSVLWKVFKVAIVYDVLGGDDFGSDVDFVEQVSRAHLLHFLSGDSVGQSLE